MDAKTFIRKVNHRLYVKKNTILNRGKFKTYISKKLPSNLVDLLNFSYNKKLSKDEIVLGNKIEELRKLVAEEYKEKGVSTFASPRSGSKLLNEDGSVIPGSFVESKKGSFARTGTGVVTGIQLIKITEALRANSIIELGTNTGLSGCYFLSAKNKPYLYTIEGSSELCKIADANLSKISNSYDVINGMFDDVIENLIKTGKKFDLAFVDGQHEEQATLLYAEKLKSIINPGGGILFDDIYWSEGMHSAWLKASKDPDFKTTLDIGSRGLCILDKDKNIDEKIHFELTAFTGKPLLNREGW